MRYGIPEYRLPRDILQKEIDWLLSWGIKVQTDIALGSDITLEQLRREFDAILLAFGCWQSTLYASRREPKGSIWRNKFPVSGE